jgi:VCBS repeat-containing protein
MKARTRIRRSVRAVSPVISVLLMIVIAVAASLIAYAWIMGYMGGTTTKAGKALLIQSFAAKPDGTELWVYVQNVGQGTVKFDPNACVYIDDVLESASIDVPAGNDPNTIKPGYTATLTIAGLSLSGTDFVKIKVVTSEGTFTQSSGLPKVSEQANHAPVAFDDSYGTDEDTPLTVPTLGVLGNDVDSDGNPLTAVKVTDPTNGDVTLNSDGSFTYMPDDGYSGSDSFTYQASDGSLDSNTATVSITVGSVNDAPELASIGPKSVDEGATLSFTATATDTDVPAQILTFSLQGNTYGASITAGGAFSWTPTESQGGSSYPITIRVTDDGSPNLYDEETITVTVNEVVRQVTFVSAGTGNATLGVGKNPTPAYPASLQPNDLILLQVTVRDTINAPPPTFDGFTLLYGPDPAGSSGRQWIYYKFSTGTESGTLTVTIGGSDYKFARMYAFRNVALSSFAEGAGYISNAWSNTISAPQVDTTGTKRLAVSFVFVTEDRIMDSFTGETDGDWTEATPEYRSSPWPGCIQLQTAEMATGGTISGGTYVMAGYGGWGVRAFALIPA